ncbi:MAG: hypothetical protein K8R48_00320 [Alphaproteobacteria bacterium]|nr:hypothetical protein [Alphaproteobacteria bacterium]
MLPNFKLALIFANLAKKHGGKILHGGDIDLLTKDLGDALRRQKKIILDPDLSALETSYEALPIIAEVKILTMAVSKKLDIDSSGKSTSAVLEEIIQKTEARNSKAAAEIKNTLEWTRDFFSQPEIQEILKADLIEIEKPRGLTDFLGMGKSLQQGAQRIGQEFSRLQEFLKKAKEQPAQKEPPKSKGPKSKGPKN